MKRSALDLNDRKAQRAADAAALDAMLEANRARAKAGLLRPPTTKREAPRTRSAGELALAADKRLGLLGEEERGE